MAETKCPKCGTTVSEFAVKCNHCRAPFPRNLPHGRKPQALIPLILILVSVVSLIAILLDFPALFHESAQSPKSVTTNAPEPSPVTVAPAEPDSRPSATPVESDQKPTASPAASAEPPPQETTSDLPVNPELCNAIKDNDITMVSELLKKGSKPNATDEHGLWTPLMLAIELNNKEMVNLLINNGANPNLSAPNSQNIPLMYASDMTMVQLLVRRGANIHLQNRLSGLSALTAAINNRSTELLEYYLNEGVNINIRDRKGMTPLMIASKLCRLDMVELLVKRGASINERDKQGQTALAHATARNSSRPREKDCSKVYIFLRDHDATL